MCHILRVVATEFTRASFELLNSVGKQAICLNLVAGQVMEQHDGNLIPPLQAKAETLMLISLL